MSALTLADLSNIGGVAALPDNVSAMHDCCVVGPFFVQVQAAVDLTITDEQLRNGQESGHRMLKLCLSDGRQQLFGIEYRRLPNLRADPPRGLKLVLHNVAVRRGVLLLTPANTCVVGGGVAAAPAAPDGARL